MMDKKYVLLWFFLWGCLSAYGQKNMGRLYEEFSQVAEAGRIQIDLQTLKMFGFSTQACGIEHIDMFDFELCGPQVKERFADAAGKVKDAAYETLITAKNDHTLTRVMVRMKGEVIREVVILRTGQKNGMIRIRGAIQKRDAEKVIESYGNGC